MLTLPLAKQWRRRWRNTKLIDDPRVRLVVSRKLNAVAGSAELACLRGARTEDACGCQIG
jgi:hypothetical protein